MDQWRVTVLGDGGVGKTALAVQVSLCQSFPSPSLPADAALGPPSSLPSTASSVSSEPRKPPPQSLTACCPALVVIPEVRLLPRPSAVTTRQRSPY